jgi:hypothetical protein
MLVDCGQHDVKFAAAAGGGEYVAPFTLVTYSRLMLLGHAGQSDMQVCFIYHMSLTNWLASRVQQQTF